MWTLQQFIKDIVKLHIYRIFSILLLLICCVCMLAYVQKHPQTAASEIEMPLETEAAVVTESTTEGEKEFGAAVTVADEEITFADPAIEAVTRYVLNQPEEKITKEAVLEIEKLDMKDTLSRLDMADVTITTLTDLQWFHNLTSLSLRDCGITDLEGIEGLNNLQRLYVSDNSISDISLLKELEKLEEVDLTDNLVTDITPLSDIEIKTVSELYGDWNVKLEGNPISAEILREFYLPKGAEDFTYTITQKLRDDMPEFTFTLEGFYDKEMDRYAVETLSISDGEVFQTVYISELAFWGQTHISHYRYEEDEIFEFIDMNFDGYLDMRLYDALNGPYEEWLYFIWNPKMESFEYADWLEGIRNAYFDQEGQLIYEMEKGGARWHTYYTYQYIDDRPALIEEYGVYGLWLSDEEIQSCLSMASLNMKAEKIEVYHEKVSNRNERTGEMEVTGNEYVFYQKSPDSMLRDEDIVLRVDLDSEIGQVISKAGEN